MNERPGQFKQTKSYVFPPRYQGPPIGEGFGDVDTQRAEAFFKEAPNFLKYITPFENQPDYPRNKTSSTQFFMRDWYDYFHKRLTSLVDYISPLLATDTLTTYTTILEFKDAMATPSEERAPKTDLEGYSWEAYKNSSKLYAKGATVLFNYGDDGGFGQKMITGQLMRTSEAINKASVFDWLLHLTSRMVNSYYAFLRNRAKKGFDADIVFEREAMLWNLTSKKDWLQKLESRRLEELTRQAGDAPLLLITNNMQNYTIFQESNIDRSRIGDDTSGGRNKSGNLGEIRDVGSEYTKIALFPDVRLPNGIFHKGLQAWTIRGNMYTVGLYRDMKYDSYDVLYDNKRVSNTQERKLSELTVQTCLDGSYLFNSGLTGDKKLRAPRTDVEIASEDDLFWGHRPDRTPLLKDRFYYPFIEFDKKKKGTPIAFHKKYPIAFSEAINTAFLKYSGLKKDEVSKYWNAFRLKYAEQTKTDLARLNAWLNDAGRDLNLAPFAHNEFKWWETKYPETSPSVDLVGWVKMIRSLYNFITGMFGEDNLMLSGFTERDGGIDRMLQVCGIFNFKYKWTFSNTFKLGDVDDTTGGNLATKTLELYVIPAFVDKAFTGITATSTTKSLKESVAVAPAFFFNEVFDTIEAHFKLDLSSCHYPLLLGYLLAEITEVRCNLFYRSNIPLSWGWGFCQPKKEHITESAIGVAPGGATLGRRIAFKEIRKGKMMDNQTYKMYMQAYLSNIMGKPENSGFYDNIHIVEYRGGDLLVPTDWKKYNEGTKLQHPDAFVIALPHFYTIPKNFADISGVSYTDGEIGKSRLIPGFPRYNAMWNLECEKGEQGVYEPYISRKLPNDIEFRIVPKCKNYWLCFEPSYLRDPVTGDWVFQPGTGGMFKELTETFYDDRYADKKLI